MAYITAETYPKTATAWRQNVLQNDGIGSRSHRYTPNPKQTRICKYCINPFLTGRVQQLYCSRKCSSSARDVHYLPGKRLPTGTVGAVNELRVATDLLLKGHEVFRSLTPNCSCDLAVIMNGELKRIEVRTGYRTNAGKIMISNSKHRADILAIALLDGIVYRPEI